jgi:serine protease Do
MTQTRFRWLATLFALILLVAACGGGDDDDDDAATGGDDDDSSEVAEGAVSSVEDVKDAVVQIVAKGSFAEPAGTFSAYEEYEGAGSGSGFIIDPSGIAVTNNHVVTGAATLDVYIGGSDEALSAKVLGVSECSDLAVIDIEGDGYPFLAWYDGDIEPGLEVRAAGFPLGDPEFTLTSGIVSKAEAAGDTDWASVESVIEHDANIQPGNSGGPLVDAETGHVVAVNYAGGDPGTGTSQFFAISSELARDTVDELQDGDVLSLGVNGQAIYDEETGTTGIWVASVDTNSAAGELGLHGGDIIEKIEGLSLGTDGTMKDYCDILRSHEETDQLAAQVLRYEEDARLRGEFNGEELEAIESLGTVIEEETGPLDETGGTTYSGEFTSISDDSSTITVEVPIEWSDVDGTPITLDDGTEIKNVSAAPDLSAFFGNWSSPGLSLSVTTTEGAADDLLDELISGATSECTDSGRDDYDDGLYIGRIQYYSSCGGTDAATIGIAASPPEGGFTALVIVQLASSNDITVLDQIIQTFTVSL